MCFIQPWIPKITRSSDGGKLLAEDHVVRGEVGGLPERAAAEVEVVGVGEPVDEVELRRPPELPARLLDRREEVLQNQPAPSETQTNYSSVSMYEPLKGGVTVPGP
jgi:hypothetical protein